MRLSQLLEGLEIFDCLSSKQSNLTSEVSDPEIFRIVHDSREVKTGDLFCCISGLREDGHTYAEAAVKLGASALLVERSFAGGDSIFDLQNSLPVVEVDSVRKSIGYVASRLEGNPSKKLNVIGITGTNGKTSVSKILAEILTKDERRSEVIGTLSGGLTTPEAPELQNLLKTYLLDGVENVVLEVSSHALDQYRINGTKFEVVAFTNLSRDHLDYHETLEKYAEAKNRLFCLDFANKAVIMVDDNAGRVQSDRAQKAGLEVVELSTAGLSAMVESTQVSFLWREREVKVPLGGRFTVRNVLLASELALLLGMEADQIVDGLSSIDQVPGRFEMVTEQYGFQVVIDYAHTPDALEVLLESCAHLSTGRVILVFGCGGDRDPGKRPLMGAISENNADVVIVTSDNPRSENPEKIISDITSGMTVSPIVATDRRTAIKLALEMAVVGDLIVVSGRGHEKFQELNETKIPFDDRLVIMEELQILKDGFR